MYILLCELKLFVKINVRLERRTSDYDGRMFDGGEITERQTNMHKEKTNTSFVNFINFVLMMTMIKTYRPIGGVSPFASDSMLHYNVNID